MLARREVIADQATPQIEQDAKSPLPQESRRSEQKDEHGQNSWEGDDRLTSEDDVLRIVSERARADENQRGGRDGEERASANGK